MFALDLGGIELPLSAGPKAHARPAKSSKHRAHRGLAGLSTTMRRSTPLFHRLLFLVVSFALVFAVAAGTSGRATVNAWSVLVDNEVVAIVDDDEQFAQELQAVLAELQEELGRPVRLACEVWLELAEPGTEGADAAKVARELGDSLPVVTGAVYVFVDGQPVVACASQEDAELAVQTVADNYRANLLKRSGVDILDFGFREQVTYEVVDACPEELRSVEDAVAILERGTDKVIEHRVVRGDTLWGIARSNSLTVTELRLANPQVKGDLIYPGDVLSLIVPHPYLNMSSSEEHTYRQAIPFGTQVRNDPDKWPWERVVVQAGRRGEKERTVLIERVNGQEVSRQLLSEQLLSSPVTQIVVQGTKTIPSLGTGQLAWPTVGSLTARFGGRVMGVVHTGIDIAAPTGTPIHAADNGTITISQSSLGGYGQVVFVDHGGGRMVTVYAHMSRRAVSVGDVVSKGQVIGYVGSTGRSTGPHLHFEVRINGTPVNPLQYYPSS